jgi:hypothetical protein
MSRKELEIKIKCTDSVWKDEWLVVPGCFLRVKARDNDISKRIDDAFMLNAVRNAPAEICLKRTSLKTPFAQIEKIGEDTNSYYEMRFFDTEIESYHLDLCLAVRSNPLILNHEFLQFSYLPFGYAPTVLSDLRIYFKDFAEDKNTDFQFATEVSGYRRGK